MYPLLPTRLADIELRYSYDGGIRVRKTVRSTSGVELHTIEVFAYHRRALRAHFRMLRLCYGNPTHHAQCAKSCGDSHQASGRKEAGVGLGRRAG
jgi:hypothetical protein